MWNQPRCTWLFVYSARKKGSVYFLDDSDLRRVCFLLLSNPEKKIKSKQETQQSLRTVFLVSNQAPICYRTSPTNWSQKRVYKNKILIILSSLLRYVASIFSNPKPLLLSSGFQVGCCRLLSWEKLNCGEECRLHPGFYYFYSHSSTLCMIIWRKALLYVIIHTYV